MATLTKGQTFGATELVTNTKLNNLVDSATIANISNAEIASDASIVGSKLDLSAPGVIGATTQYAIDATIITCDSVITPSYNLVMWENDFVSYDNDAITII